MNKKNISIEIGEKTKVYTQLLVEVNDTIKTVILEKTKCPKDRLPTYFDNNVYFYNISANVTSITEIIDAAEHIANNMSTDEFIQTILTDNGKDMMPAIMHNIMQTKYELKDEVEWFVSLLFVNLGGLITQPAFCYRTIEEDMEADDCDVLTIAL